MQILCLKCGASYTRQPYRLSSTIEVSRCAACYAPTQIVKNEVRVETSRVSFSKTFVRSAKMKRSG